MNERPAEQQAQYISFKEVAEEMGIKRVSLYHYIEKLNLETYKFEMNRNMFLKAEDVERIRQIRQAPIGGIQPTVKRRKK